MDLRNKHITREKSAVMDPQQPRFRNIVPEIFGSIGTVICFSAFDNALEYEVLIHRLSQPMTKDVLLNVERLRKLNHVNIASFYDLVTSSLDGSTYLVSEVLDTHLENVMYSEQMTFNHIKLFAYQIMRGLKYLHSADLFHGSLNPFNILVSYRDLLLKISGLQTKNEYLNTESGLSYCPPEKLMNSGNYSFFVDIWSAGCILTEMFLKRKLFQGLSAQETLVKITDIIYLSEADWSQIFKVIPNKVLKNHRLKPREPLRMIFACWDMHVMLLLESMLAFDADRRITAKEALSHPFFDEYHSFEVQPSMSDDILNIQPQDDLMQKRCNEKLMCESFSMDDILNADVFFHPSDTVALNNFRNNLEKNSPPNVRTPSPNIMDLLQSSPLPKSISGHYGKNLRGSPSNTNESLHSFSASVMERVCNNSLISISSSSSCNSINSISSKPSSKELQSKLKHVFGSDSEKEMAEVTDEKLKEDAEINGITEALRHFKTAVDFSFSVGNISNDSSKNEDDQELQRTCEVSPFLQNLQHNLVINKIEEEEETKLCSSLNVWENQSGQEEQKLLLTHGLVRGSHESGFMNTLSIKNFGFNIGEILIKQDVEDQKKLGQIEGTWVPCGRKLLLEQLETEKKSKLWSGCNLRRKHLNSRSKEETEDYLDVGCKLTSSEFDELYRLPTEHLRKDPPLWRRYADDMNHSLANHHNHHYHFFHNEDGSRSSRLSEGGACGGYDYGSLDDLGPSNVFCNSCIKCDPKISAGPWLRSDFSPEESDAIYRSCPMSRVICGHKKCFTPRVLSTSSDERHTSPESPPSSPPFSQSHSGARPKKSRKYFRK